MVASITMLQTASGEEYEKLLEISSICNRAYCLSSGIDYRVFKGVKRGYYHWQATFNRVAMLDELVREAYSGWVLFVDADAYVKDMSFSLGDYIDGLPKNIAFVAEPGTDTAKWDVNAGVFLINLGSQAGRRIVSGWRSMEGVHTPDRWLKEAIEPWGKLANGDTLLNDQSLLHLTFQEHPDLLDALMVEKGLLNYASGRFISQLIRKPGLSSSQRLTELTEACLRSISGSELFRKQNLDVLANVKGTDKGTTVGNAHGYTKIYSFLFEQFKFQTFNALELGLLRGGPEAGGVANRLTHSVPSIDMWLEYFPFANLFGIDISDFSHFQHQRFRSYRLDLSDLQAALCLRARLPRFKFIIDDASHASYHQQLAFCVFFPLVESGGYYVIEDCDWQPAHMEKECPASVLTRSLFEQFSQYGDLLLPGDLREAVGGRVENQISDVFLHRKPSERSEGGVIKMVVIRKL